MQECYYCSENEATDESIWYQHELFFVVKKISFPVGLKYKSEKIKVPRCESCLDKHSNIALPGLLLWLISFVILLIIFLRSGEAIIILAIILSIFISAFIAGGAVLLFNFLFFESIYKIKAEENIEDFPIIVKMLDEGWILNKPDPASGKDSEDYIEERKWFKK